MNWNNIFLDMNWCLKALEEVNKKIAASFNQSPKAVHFTFVDYIDRKAKKTNTYIYFTAGQTNLLDNEIKLVTRRGWQETAVHELIHIYNPEMSEKQVEKITEGVVKYLLSFKGVLNP